MKKNMTEQLMYEKCLKYIKSLGEYHNLYLKNRCLVTNRRI